MANTEIIKIENLEEGGQAVWGRDLYDFLEIKEKYTQWFNRMIAYGFDERVDYVATSEKTDTANGGYTSKINHLIRIDAAKEICMIQRSDKGKQARRYFIKIEKKYKALQAQSVDSYMIADPVERAQRWIAEEQQRQALAQEIEESQPKVEYHDAILRSETLMTTTEIAADYGLSAIALNNILASLDVQYKRGNRWYLYSQYNGKGYTQSKTALYDDGCKTKTSMQWTQAGREFIYKKLYKIGINPSSYDEDAEPQEVSSAVVLQLVH